MKLDPDIVTLGKIVGGGFPIGVISGKDEIMEHANTSMNSKKNRTYIGGGTFSANPLTMIAGDTTLDVLKNKSTLYKKLDGLGKDTTKMLKKVFADDAIVTGKGSLFMTHFPRNEMTEIINATDAAKCDQTKLFNYHFDMLAKNGIFFLPGKLGAFSDAHSKSDIKEMKCATESFVSNLKR